MNPRSVINDVANALLVTEGRVTAARIVEKAYASYAGVFAEEAERLAHASALNLAKEALRGLSEDDDDDGQMQLGLGLPTAIAVPEKDGYVYVHVDQATWPDLKAGRNIRSSNVARAQARLDAYDSALNRLRPYMENDPTLTVAEAVADASGGTP